MEKNNFNIISAEQRATAHGFNYAHLIALQILHRIKEKNQLSREDSWRYSAHKVYRLRIFLSKRPKFIFENFKTGYYSKKIIL